MTEFIQQIPAALLLAATFAAWGLLLSLKLTRPGMVLGWLPKIIPPDVFIAQPIYSCATCVAGFQGGITCMLLGCYTDFSLMLMAPTILIGAFMALYVEFTL